jgi:hypothetical protein
MNLHIDPQNLIQLFKAESNAKKEDCIRLIKRQLDVVMNFEKTQVVENPELQACLNELTTGVGDSNTMVFNPNYLPDDLKTNSINQFDRDQLSTVYLTSSENVKKKLGNGMLSVGSYGEELETLHKLLLFQDDYDFSKKLRIGNEGLTSWGDLCEYKINTSDILIIDKFIAHDPSLIESNLGELLKTLTTNIHGKVNVILFTEKSSCLHYDVVSKTVRNCVKQSTGVSPNFTLVKYTAKRNIGAFNEHDRTILLNYYRLYSGDSFNYFNSNGETITAGRELDLSSLAKKSNYILANNLIEDVQKVIDWLTQNDTGIEGDKKSHFLNFG